MSNEKQEQSEMSYGYFILAEDQRKKIMIRKSSI